MFYLFLNKTESYNRKISTEKTKTTAFKVDNLEIRSNKVIYFEFEFYMGI